MNEKKVEHLIFKDDKGKILSIADKVEESDSVSDIKITLNIQGSTNFEIISKDEFDKLGAIDGAEIIHADSDSISGG